jgi:hypothetical protein
LTIAFRYFEYHDKYRYVGKLEGHIQAEIDALVDIALETESCGEFTPLSPPVD